MIEIIIVIIFGLFIGYWLVSKIISTTDQHKVNNEKKETNNTKSQQTELWYQVLKVSPNATIEEIQMSYKSQIRQYHPDKVATLGEELKALAEEKSKAINAAYKAALSARGG